MDILIFLLIFSGLIGVWASKLGRNGVLWFFVALLISPLITAVILLIIGADKDTEIENEAQKAAAVEKRKKEITNQNE